MDSQETEGLTPTRVQRFLWWCQNHRIISLIVILAVIVIGAGQTTSALSTLINFFTDETASADFQVDDRDFIDNKGAYKPTTNVTQNPRPESEVAYRTLSLNEEKDGGFQSEFVLTLLIPQGGWIEGVTFPSSLTCKRILPQRGDVLGGQGYGINGTVNIQEFRLSCFSLGPIVDNGHLFNIY